MAMSTEDQAKAKADAEAKKKEEARLKKEAEAKAKADADKGARPPSTPPANPVKNILTAVKFVKDHAPYHKGEIAGFNKKDAEVLIKMKVARKK